MYLVGARPKQRWEATSGSVLALKHRYGPDGIHLFDRRTGLNVLLDEVDVEEAQWARAPRQVSIALTNACDLDCPFCYAPKNAAVLDVARVCAWLDELDAADCFGVGFGGGEPTLYRRLAEVCRYAEEQTRLAVTMTTHGHRWTPKMIDALAGAVNFVRVSVDGVGETYEQLRRRSYADLVRRIAMIGKVFQIGLNCVVNTSTLPDLTAVAELAASVGAAELLLLPEQPARGRKGITSHALAALHRWIESYPGPVPLALGSGDAGHLAIAEPLPKEIELRAYAHIDASGMLRRTSYDPTGEAIDHRGVIAAIRRLERGASE
ncbi:MULTISPECIES: radical SAM protein [Mycobacterium]|uniref:radical SAM protein n=1 Tax=Mycobacterium TaxID=1763 RepID=UPI0013F3C7AE|nr:MULTISPECIES: radical SAM protein [Mycobacterium]UQB90480.1 radical SAM protein [Mycobacterium intracellulare]WSE44269.1 radical SAM protein [Mycobacterium sp. 3-98]